LKKNKVAVDIVNFGEESAEGNEEKLRALHEAVNNHDNSTFVTIPAGSSMLAESLHHTRIIRSGATAGTGGGSTAATGAAAGAGGGGEPDFGIDPNLDPELAIALRLSMETAEQERRNRDVPAATGASGGSAPPANTPTAPQGMEVDDPEMAEALRLSMMSVEADNGPSSPPSATPPALATTAPSTLATTPVPPSVGTEDDDDFKKAMELSKQTAGEEQSKDKAKQDDMDTSAISQDELASILKNLPGVDFSVVEQEMKKKEQEEKEKKKDH